MYDAQTRQLSEIVYVTARSGDTLTVLRGQENTIARGWGPGDLLINNLTAGSLANFVQSGGPPQSSTSIIYVGNDTSSTVNLINARTNPIPATLVPGMQFNIKMANTNNGPTVAQINGAASIPVTRADGSAMAGKELTIAQEMIFVYNGTALVAMYPGATGTVLPPPSPTVPPTPAAPQQNIFYVAESGNDGWDGLTNIPVWGSPGPPLGLSLIHGPCASVQGVINKFFFGQYPPVSDVWIYVASGIYGGGFYDRYGAVVGTWHIIGDPSILPTISAIDTADIACLASGNAKFDLQNLELVGQTSNVFVDYGAIVTATNCKWLSPLAPRSYSIIAREFGKIYLYGHHTMVLNAPGLIGWVSAADGGQIIVGGVLPGQPATIEFVSGIGSIEFIVESDSNSLVTFSFNSVIFLGPTQPCPPYHCMNGGGLALHGCVIPGTGPGVVISPAWVSP